MDDHHRISSISGKSSGKAENFWLKAALSKSLELFA
jgi:hypothetical protein